MDPRANYIKRYFRSFSLRVKSDMISSYSRTYVFWKSRARDALEIAIVQRHRTIVVLNNY